MYTNKYNSFFALSVFLFFVITSLWFYGDTLFTLKYISVNIVGSLLMTNMIMLTLYDTKKGIALFFIFFPLITWYKSVFYITIDFLLIDPFLVLLLFYNLVFLYKNIKIKMSYNVTLLFLTFVFLFQGIFYSISVDNLDKIYFLINEFLEPFLFVSLLTLLFNLYKEDIIYYFDYIIKKMFIVSSCILIVEMILRSSGKPWLFLIYGGRRGYSGTTGDLTAGFGEPVTMGLFAAFFLVYFLFIKRERYFILYLTFLLLLSIAKSALLAIFAMIFFMYIKIGSDITHYIKKKYIVFFMLLGSPLLFITIKRFLGSNNSDTVSNMNIGNMTIATDVNLIHNITHAITWADPYIDVEWYIQFLLLPLIGGINNVVFIEKNIAIFFLNISILIFLAYQYIYKGNYYTKSVSIVLLTLYSYYGAFTSTVYNFYFLSDKLPVLGYVPRMEPKLLFIIIIVSLIITKKKVKKNVYFSPKILMH